MSKVLGNFGKENSCPLANDLIIVKKTMANSIDILLKLKLIVCTYLLSRLGDYSTETDSSQRY